jgi:hypothetical protein
MCSLCIVQPHIITNNTKCWVLPWKYNAFPLYSGAMSHKTDACCCGYRTMCAPYTAIKLQNISYCCEQYKCTQVLYYIYLILRKFGFPWQIFTGVGNIKYDTNLSGGSPADTCGWADKLKTTGTLRELCEYALNRSASTAVMAYFKVLSQHLADGNEKGHKKPQTY